MPFEIQMSRTFLDFSYEARQRANCNNEQQCWEPDERNEAQGRTLLTFPSGMLGSCISRYSPSTTPPNLDKKEAAYSFCLLT